MSHQEFDHLLQQYLSGNSSQEGERKVYEWYEQLMAQSRLELALEERQNIEAKIWTGTLADMGQYAQPAATGKVVRMSPLRPVRAAMAACLILLAGVGLYFFTSVSRSDPYRATLGVPEGYQAFANEGRTGKAIRLADGSLVTLQPRATLYYPGTFSQKTRDVYLKGDAFFSVARNPARQFIVHAGEGLQTEVLGTSFHILQLQNARKVEVSVVTGKVWVHPPGKSAASPGASTGVVLTPNQKAVYHAATSRLLASLADKPQLLHPEAGSSFVFKNAPLTTVLQAIEEAYGIDITAVNKRLENCHFTGDLTGMGLYEKLQLLCQSTRASYQVKETTIELTGAGCP